MWSVDLSLRKPKGQGCWLQPTEDCLTYFNDVSSLKAVELKKLCTIHGTDETYPKKKCNPPDFKFYPSQLTEGERGGSVVECRTPEREVIRIGQSAQLFYFILPFRLHLWKALLYSTAAVLCPWARHFTPRKYWLITQEAMAPSRHDWKIVDWDVKPQHNQPINWWKFSPYGVMLNFLCFFCIA